MIFCVCYGNSFSIIDNLYSLFNKSYLKTTYLFIILCKHRDINLNVTEILYQKFPLLNIFATLRLNLLVLNIVHRIYKSKL